MGRSTQNASRTTGEEKIKEEELKEQVVGILKTIYDPEIPVSIYELGLIYDIEIIGDKSVFVKMTLTSPGCPVAASLPIEMEQKIKEQLKLHSVTVEVVWEPQWTPAMMSEAAKLELNIDFD